MVVYIIFLSSVEHQTFFNIKLNVFNKLGLVWHFSVRAIYRFYGSTRRTSLGKVDTPRINPYFTLTKALFFGRATAVPLVNEHKGFPLTGDGRQDRGALWSTRPRNKRISR